ncbi:hypothetical protein D3C71_1026730 [compost metagenome]
MVLVGLLQQHGGWNPKHPNLDPAFALVFLGMLKLEEVGAALDVIQVRMSESHHVEVVAIDCLQFVLETGLQVDFRGVGIFGSIAVAKVEENAAAARQDNLGGVPVSDRVKDNLMHVCHKVLLVQDKWQLCYLALYHREC